MFNSKKSVKCIGGGSVVEKIISAPGIKGFTLAEVLITLAIIGVVVALTIPTLVQNYKKKEYSTRLKQFYSMMSQAVMLSEIDNGPKSSWKKQSMQYDEDGNRDLEAERLGNYEFFMTYLAPYLKYSKETIRDNNEFYLTNGTQVSMWNGTYVDFTIDVNNTAPPNKRCQDMFRFYLDLNNNAPITIPMVGTDLSRAQIIEQIKKNDLDAYCTTLLYKDNWEFKDDYPYKL